MKLSGCPETGDEVEEEKLTLYQGQPHDGEAPSWQSCGGGRGGGGDGTSERVRRPRVLEKACLETERSGKVALF